MFFKTKNKKTQKSRDGVRGKNLRSRKGSYLHNTHRCSSMRQLLLLVNSRNNLHTDPQAKFSLMLGRKPTFNYVFSITIIITKEKVKVLRGAKWSLHTTEH